MTITEEHVRIDEFGDQGEWAVIHTASVAQAIRAYARQVWGKDVPWAEADRFAREDFADCATDLIRHEAWPDEDGGENEAWFTRDSRYGPTGERKAGVILDEDDQAVLATFCGVR